MPYIKIYIVLYIVIEWHLLWKDFTFINNIWRSALNTKMRYNMFSKHKYLNKILN